MSPAEGVKRFVYLVTKSDRLAKRIGVAIAVHGDRFVAAKVLDLAAGSDAKRDAAAGNGE